jgi:hypothetical protein
MWTVLGMACVNWEEGEICHSSAEGHLFHKRILSTCIFSSSPSSHIFYTLNLSTIELWGLKSPAIHHLSIPPFEAISLSHIFWW